MSMLAVVVGGLLRLLVSYIFTYVVNHDTIGWATVGAWTLQGKSIYPYPAYEYHAFFPAFLYINAAALWMQRFGIPFMFFNKAVCSLFDAGNIYLVYLLSKRNKKIAWLYALNPLSVMTVGVHGQFESIPVFFLLLGVYFLEKKKVVWSGLALSYAVLFKTWPVIFVIPFLKRVWKWWYLALVCLLPLIASIFYIVFFHSNLIDIIHYTLFYRGQSGNFGAGYIFSFLTSDPVSLKLFSNAFLLLFAWFSFKNDRGSMIAELCDQMLFFFILSPTFGLQWMMWIVPFILMELPRWYYLFLISATIYLGNVNVFWILREWNAGFVKYVTQFGLLSWASLVFIALNRLGMRLQPYIVTQDDLSDNKKGENKHDKHD